MTFRDLLFLSRSRPLCASKASTAIAIASAGAPIRAIRETNSAIEVIKSPRHREAGGVMVMTHQ